MHASSPPPAARSSRAGVPTAGATAPGECTMRPPTMVTSACCFGWPVHRAVASASSIVAPLSKSAATDQHLLAAHRLLVPHVENHAKSGLARHHSLIRGGCIFERQNLRHGYDAVRVAELQVGFIFD